MAKRELTNTTVQGPPVLKLLVPEEAAEFLRISMAQLYHLTSAKKLPFLKVGGQLRFELASLVEHLRAAADSDGETRSRPRGVIRLEGEGFRFATPKRGK